MKPKSTPTLRPVAAPPAPAPTRRATDLRPTAILGWEEPPPKKTPGKRQPWFAALLPQLRIKPKTWAKVLITRTQAAAAARSGTYLKSVKNGMSPKGFEFCARPLPDGRGAVYARYTGD